MRILVVNPNTTASMTKTIEAAATSAAAKGTMIEATTSGMGPVSIEGYYDEVFAMPGLLAEIRRGEAGGAQAAVIACFDDTGLDAARSMASIPVIGICEAALTLASFVASRFTVVTTSERSRVPVEELVRRYGFASRAKVRVAGVPVLALEDPTSGAVARLKVEIARALDDDHAEAIVLGCAGMADLAAELAAMHGLPVIDGVTAAVTLAEALVRLGLKTSRLGPYAVPRSKPYDGLLSQFRP